jgi:iron complex transport system permease protein
MIRVTLIILALIGMAASLLIGPAPIDVSEAINGVLGQADAATNAIMREVRLPRALGALVVGAGLGASGAALQGFTRNDLAAPGLLGFSACAALGAVTALYFGLAAWLMPAAIAGALVGAIIIAVMARRQVGAGGLILAGIGIGALATAITGLLMNLAPNPWALSELTYWLMGSLENVDAGGLIIAAPLTLIGLVALWRSGSPLRALSLGEDTATSLGVSLPQVQALIVIGTALCIGAGVALAGTIGFVGLFVPHIMRRLSGPDPAALIGHSALAGGVFLLATDTIARITAGPGTPLYLGIVTSLIGVPFFLYLALRRTTY